MSQECREYLKRKFMSGDHPAHPNDPNAKVIPTEEQWNEIPEAHMQWMVDLVMGFNNDSNPLLDKIMAAYNNKAHSDMSFGMEVKSIIYANKPK